MGEDCKGLRCISFAKIEQFVVFSYCLADCFLFYSPY